MKLGGGSFRTAVGFKGKAPPRPPEDKAYFKEFLNVDVLEEQN